MKPIKRILYPTDFSAMSVLGYQYCLNLARQLKARVDVLHVYRIDLGVPVTDPIAYKMIEERKENAHLKLGRFAHLQKTGQQKLTEGLDIHAHASVGLPEDEIVAFSKKNDIDLIVMPTHGEHNIIESLFGSVTTEVAATSHCPVLIVPEQVTYRKITDIAYATDLSLENMNQVSMPLALAELLNSNLHYVHVYSDKKAEPGEVDELLTANSADIEVLFHELKGKTVQEGLKLFLKEKSIDLLMAYSPPKNFFERLFRLSTTRHLLEHITCPLMVMR
ncbi:MULTISPECIES: universal stress protein [unclassified Aureispira]|uniref:universal stress protein n=1 Tax=unclassified Aureispira TaxID=2649989 RepID=UPI000698D554|nr:MULTISPECIES: universal stress protein [unclassified Aureispira]WMX12637.1 universal stress protein [Aureispira sp. CCB-E]